LLPKDQQPLVLDDSTLASDAIERLVDNGFSQIPVHWTKEEPHYDVSSGLTGGQFRGATGPRRATNGRGQWCYLDIFSTLT